MASDPKPGQFAVNSGRRVVLANDPADHTVEVTTRERRVMGSSNDATLEGFAIKHAANDRSGVS